MSDLGQHPAFGLQFLDLLQPRKMLCRIDGSAPSLHRPVEKASRDIEADGPRRYARFLRKVGERLGLAHACNQGTARYCHCQVLFDIQTRLALHAKGISQRVSAHTRVAPIEDDGVQPASSLRVPFRDKPVGTGPPACPISWLRTTASVRLARFWDLERPSRTRMSH